VKLSRSSRFEKQYRHWLAADPRVAAKIDELIDAVCSDPFKGIGKPEPLRHGLKGYWSRRITDEHRLVYSPDNVQLSPVEKLGELMLYDSSLSNPPGYSCATCHVPETGFTGPKSEINAFSGPQPGVVPGRFSNRKPQSYLYAAFSPVGPYYDPGLRTRLGGNFWNGRVADLAGQALQPPLNPNEMANIPEGPYPPATDGYSPLLVQKLANRPYTALFKQLYGEDAF
jgi:cytochrome c peroxidase